MCVVISAATPIGRSTRMDALRDALTFTRIDALMKRNMLTRIDTLTRIDVLRGALCAEQCAARYASLL